MATEVKTVTSDTARLQQLMREILHGQTDAFVVGYLSADGVTQLCVGGDVQTRDQQKVAHKLLFAHLLRNTAHEFDADEAEFVEDGLRLLDDEDALLEEAVKAGLLPEDPLSRYQGGDDDTLPDMLRNMLRGMVADADYADVDGMCPFCGGGHVGNFCPENPANSSGDDSDDEDGESGGTNIPVE